MARKSLAHLHRRIAEIEGQGGWRPPAGGEAGNPASFSASSRASEVDFGVAPLDRKLGGGLRRNALHEVCSGTTRDAAAATGFAAALLARLSATDERPILWVVEASAAREAGLPYGLGLDRFGLDSRKLVIVRVRRPGEALWVFEEGLRCRGLCAAMAEIHGAPRALDLTASRRLMLRARESGVMALLLCQAGKADASAALTRWLVSPLPATASEEFPAGIGRPAWRLVLDRSRNGATGSFDLEWDHGARTFAEPAPAIPPLPLPHPPLSADGPDLPAKPWPPVALRWAS